MLSETWAVDPEIRSRFVQEAKLLRRIHNEHVVTVHDSGELDDGRPYFVMDYTDRGTLEDRLGFTPPGRPIDAKTTRRVVLALTDGLAALYRSGDRPSRRQAGEPPPAEREPRARRPRLRPRSERR